MKEYYDELRNGGMPFAKNTSAKYDPAEMEFLKDTLFEFRTKNKSSPLMQMADLFVWPIAMGGYNQACRPYARLLDDGKLLDCHLEPENIDKLGIKYYCFDDKKPG